jgi:hypothetical protein
MAEHAVGVQRFGGAVPVAPGGTRSVLAGTCYVKAGFIDHQIDVSLIVPTWEAAVSSLVRALAVALPLLMATAGTVSAQRDQGGCGGSGLSCSELRYYCGLGRETPISVRLYCGGRGGYAPYRRYREDGDRRRELSYGELRYYCSLGRETPISVRQECIRRGLW